MKENDEQHQGSVEYHAKSVEDILSELNVGRDGLSSDEVVARQEKYGLNQLEEEKQRSGWAILLDQFKSIVIIILAIAAVLAFVTARLPEGIALVTVIAVNTAIGFFTEWKAIRSMESLRELGRKVARVRRDGRESEVAAVELVPGDIVLLHEEELVPADVRILSSEYIRVNEAALTGESMPVDKSIDSVEQDAPLHARTSMLYKGTSVVEGTAEGVVAATGSATELGRISKLVSAAEETAAPLQERLDNLGRKLAWITIAVAVLVGAAGLAAGRETIIMIETAIALGVAAIPEGLPIVATIALARGMWLMAQRNALINRLTAVETLGATSVIFTDKTGTLTENRMTVVNVITADASYTYGQQEDEGISGEGNLEAAAEKSLVERLLRIGLLCSNAKPTKEGGEGFSGDPTEVALLEAAVKAGLTRSCLLEEMPEEREVPFDSEVMMMATFHRLEKDKEGGACYVAVKGAPGKILEVCNRVWREEGEVELSKEQKQQWHERVDELAGKGLRLLAFADKEAGDSAEEPYRNLRLVGIAGMEDPPRSDVREAIRDCQNAGIKVVMVTGDRPDTGASIGKKVGLTDEEEPFHGSDLSNPDELSSKEHQKILDSGIFARVTPEQKFNLVKHYQSAGHICAMTGDGVNDTPALKQADIGVAMGQRGTDAAKQVADMVLRDDNFSTIVTAIREGRIIFANIRKSVIFMLCTNIAEVLTVALASLVQAPLPLKPLQILYLNVLTDVFPALALGVGAGAVEVMKRPPRAADEAVLTWHHWRMIGGWSLFIGAIVLGALTIALMQFGFEEKHAVTISFLTLAFTKLWFVINLRDRGTSPWKNDVLKNRWVWAAWGICLSLLLIAVYWQPLASVLQVVNPGWKGWTLILAMSVLPVIVGAFLPGIRFYSAGKEE